MAKWVVEACLIHAVKLSSRAENLVCVNIEKLTFKHPVQKGEVIDIETFVGHMGTTSLTIGARVYTSIPILETVITFVTLNEEGRPTPHELGSDS
jgi:acyl-CoA hydrolase